MQTIYLDPDQVPAQLRQGYSGRKFKAVIGETVTIPATAGLYDGGSRDVYSYVRLADGMTAAAPNQSDWPGSANRRAIDVTLVPGYLVVRHSVFCGKDMGLTFYMHPDNAVAMLPTHVDDLSPIEKLVLVATRSLKSSYGGRDRYQMAERECEYTHNQYARALAGNPFPTRTQWSTAKETLRIRGYLNAAGAITVAGRNAAGR